MAPSRLEILLAKRPIVTGIVVALPIGIATAVIAQPLTGIIATLIVGALAGADGYVRKSRHETLVHQGLWTPRG
ncbi:hypothetical protein [Streptomyces paludis]|uniref:Uncharacterized protein n=1 Tax=Streptomyces paludis TaxID=2282738 RepID=A0A345HQD4_9ACTN|nr:hypothetical protein [Streptomyces paludis]AXG78908.1 hypothetical protein DVK44_15715 [Streptomyces paludis]